MAEYEPLAVLGEIKEKGFSSDAAPQLPSITALAFPVARHRSHGPHWGALAPSHDEIVDMEEFEGPVEDGRAAARPLERRKNTGMDSQKWRDLAAAHRGTNPDAQEEIDAENRARISSMTEEEISDAHMDLLRRLGPDKVKMLQKRGKDKEKQRKEKEEESVVSPSPPPRTSAAINPKNGDQLVTEMEIDSSVETNGGNAKVPSGCVADAWTERIESVKSMRFSLDGEVIGTKVEGNADFPNAAERDFLRTEGDPSALGYTIKEAALLSRSTVPAHRAAALQLFGATLSNVANGVLEGRSNYDWQAIWAYALGPHPELTLTLRLALDDTHLTCVVSCAKALQTIISCPQNDEFFNLCESSWPGGPLWYTAPVFRKRSNHEDDGFLGGGFWKYNVKPSELLVSGANDSEMENNDTTVADDATVATKDVAAGFIRMGILPRIRYILEVEKLDASVNAALLSALIAFARHSPAGAKAVMECPRLINTVVQRFLLPDEESPAPPSPVVRAKAIQLLKVLSQVSKSYCVHFAELGALQAATFDLFEWSYRFSESRNAAAAKDLPRHSTCLREALRLWKACAVHGIGISLFPDFHPALSSWLAPPSSKSFAPYDLTHESYSVLEVLAAKLPVTDTVRGNAEQQTLEAAGWSWSIAISMVGYSLSWLQQAGIDSEAEMMALGSVLHFLATICEKLHSDPAPLPDFVPKVSSALARVRAWLVSDTIKTPTHHAKLTLANFIQAHARLANAIDKLTGRGESRELALAAVAQNKLAEIVNLDNLHGEEQCGCVARGGPAPGVGFGWSSRVPGGGLWTSKLLAARVHASSSLLLLETERQWSVTLKTKLQLVALATEPSLLERALQRHILSEEQWLAILDKAVTQLNEKIAEAPYDVTRLKGGREFLIQHFTELWLERKEHKKHKQEKEKDKLETIQEEDNEEEINGDSILRLREWRGTRLPLPCHWILSPLHSKNSDVILAGLLLLLGLEVERAVDIVPLVRKVHALSLVFAAGDAFLDSPVSDALGVLQSIYCYESGDRSAAVDFQGGVDASYTLFVEGLAHHFASASYGDAKFGRQLAFYLRPRVAVPIQQTVWRCLAQAEVLSLLPGLEECGQPAAYFDPPQRNVDLLDMYVSSWINGGLDRAFVRKALPFSLALHHVAHFIFDTDDDGALLLHKQKFARSISRSSKRSKESKDMFAELVRYFPGRAAYLRKLIGDIPCEGFLG